MTVTQAEFDSLLAWLNPDRDLAGRKYKTIHSGLVRIFVSRGFNDAEDLADETINRVIRRLPDIREIFVGEPAQYFCGIARNIIRENNCRREIVCNIVDVRVELKPDEEEEHDCLDHCLQDLPTGKRDLILEYYLYDGHEKIEHHRNMAKELDITIGAFRNRVHQIRMNLKNSMRQCSLSKKSGSWPKSQVLH
jgi:DNA-directed RNA polymerase specialized sigma24 family protein